MVEAKKPVVWLRRILPGVSVVLLAALFYDGSIFYSRWRGERDYKQALVGEEAEHARKTLEILGGDRLHIVSFYATPGVIAPGGPATLCYGVNGAKKIRMEPPVDDLKPALSRCLQVAPRNDTEYTLIAEDAAGHTVSESFVLKVTR